MRKKIASQKGAAIVEFAIILPLVLLILLGIIDFAVMLYNQHVITNASREGARYGIAWDSDRTKVKQVAEQYCSSNLINFGGSSSCNATPIICASSGDNLQVQVTYNYYFLGYSGILSFFGSTIANPFQLSANTTMVCQ